MILDRFDRAFPRLAFARRIPPRRIAVRVLRRIEERAGLIARVRPGEATLRATGSLPQPVFPPRPIRARRDASGWSFEFIGLERTFAGAIAWNPSDPVLGQLWRMNLHYMEYLEVLPPEDGRDAIRQWIADNLPEAPGACHAAWNRYALSLRVVCWMQWLARYGDTLGADDLAAIETSLRNQLAVLARFPETDLGGNHLIKNIKALLWGGACFAGPEAQRWTGAGLALLRAELPRQILPDGFHFELSPSYHAQVTADLIECRALLDGAERAAVERLLPGMLRAAVATTHPDGATAQFGDAGLEMAYRAEALVAAAGWTEAADGAVVLPDAGFAAISSPALSAIMKFGAIGADSLPAHAHGDTGSFELSWGPDRVVVDQGVFEYVEGPRRRTSRAAVSHNVTAPEAPDMADFFGAFRCGRRPRSQVHEAVASASRISVSASHDGFAYAGPGHCNRVTRALTAQPDRVVIVDRLSAGAGPGWASRFLLHPDWACHAHAGGIVLEREGRRLVLQFAGRARIDAAVWWPDMGRELATRRIVIPWVQGMTELTMTFAPA